jgi:S-adenosylmethionine:diacylglycerol 3-amino-3-carboxypropyl transferase
VHRQTYARPNGDVWVLRSRGARDPIAIYDVFTRTGGLIRRVAFPRATRLVGFGSATLYTVRLDDDDLQYLERWRLPSGIRP